MTISKMFGTAVKYFDWKLNNYMLYFFNENKLF